MSFFPRLPTRRKMNGHILSTVSARVPRSQLLYTTLERHTVCFLRWSACKRFSTSFHRNLTFRNASSAHVIKRGSLNPRRWKGDNARNETTNTSELQPKLGDDPPLYDAKPPFWAQWVYVLLALDVLFIGTSVDMVLSKWSHKVPDTSTDPPGKKWELRPLWHRLSLATFEILIGAAAGALILVSRDRVVWRIRIRRVPITSLASSHPGMLPSPSTEQTINVMTLETGSGRTKRFLVKHSALAPGRDLSEVILRIGGIRTTFFLSMNRARVLGLTEDETQDSAILKELKKSKMNEARLSSINANVPGASDVENNRIADLRKVLVFAWEKVGGNLDLPNVAVVAGGWTSGPVTGQR